jgi:hypothetical protein
MNDYYILAIGQLNLLERSEIVENLGTVRYNLAGNKFMVKTRLGLGIDDVPFMNPNTALTHAEIKIELAKPEWTNNEI